MVKLIVHLIFLCPLRKSNLNVLPFLSGMVASADFGKQMYHGYLASQTWCGVPPGLVGPQFLDESQMHWSSVGSGTEACHARSPTKVDEISPNCSVSGLSSGCQVPESLPEVCVPIPGAKSGVLCEAGESMSFEVMARKTARIQGQSAGRDEDGGSSGVSRPLPGPNSSPAVSGRRRRALLALIDHLMWRTGKLEESLMKRAVKTLAARRFCQTALGTLLKFVIKRVLPLVENATIDGALVAHSKTLLRPGNSASPWFAASCCRDGSLAVIQPIWVQKTFEESSPYGNVHVCLVGDVHSPVRASGFEREGFRPTACAIAPMLVVVIAASETRVSTKTVLVKQRWLH